MQIYSHNRPNKEYMENYNQNKHLSHLTYLDKYNLYRSAMLQKLAVSMFEWEKDI